MIVGQGGRKCDDHGLYKFQILASEMGGTAQDRKNWSGEMKNKISVLNTFHVRC